MPIAQRRFQSTTSLSWMRETISCLVTLVTMLGVGNESLAQSSIWLRRDPAIVNRLLDVKARRPGDLLIVQINERSNVENRDQRLLQKNNKSSSKAGLSAGLAGLFGDKEGDMNFDQSSSASRQLNGNTQFRSERGYIDQFTVTVVDVTPGGNLLVSGTRAVTVEGDTRRLVLTGIVRAADISDGNTVLSSQIADLEIGYEACEDEGAERRYLNHGWLGKKLNRWWPH